MDITDLVRARRKRPLAQYAVHALLVDVTLAKRARSLKVVSEARRGKAPPRARCVQVPLDIGLGVSPEGDVGNNLLCSVVPPLLVQSAMDAIRQWQLRIPKRLRGILPRGSVDCLRIQKDAAASGDGGRRRVELLVKVLPEPSAGVWLPPLAEFESNYASSFVMFRSSAILFVSSVDFRQMGDHGG